MSQFDKFITSRRSIIEQLREKHPGEWNAVRHGFGWEWHGPLGVVRVCSVLSNPGYDDEKCHSEYYDDNGNCVGSHGVIF